MIDHCYECDVEEYTQHKLSCDSKDVFNAYLILRDGDLTYFTDEMISTLGFKLFIEDAERMHSKQTRNEE
jgi:hypothetical protein